MTHGDEILSHVNENWFCDVMTSRMCAGAHAYVSIMDCHTFMSAFNYRAYVEDPVV